MTTTNIKQRIGNLDANKVMNTITFGLLIAIVLLVWFHTNWIGFSITMALLSIVGYSLWAITKNSEVVHRDLDNFMERARAAKNILQLCMLRIEVEKYHYSYCHVKPYGNHAREVLTFIDGKLSGF